MRQPHTYALYVFDLGGVLLDGINVCERIQGILGEEFGDHYHRYIDALMAGSMENETFWKLFREKTGKQVREDYLDSCFKPILNPETAQVIKHLRNQGSRVVYGSNTFASHFTIMQEMGVLDLFDGGYASHSLGIEKPRIGFYQAILHAEGVEGKDVFFCDDRMENIEGARSCGIDAVLFTDARSLGEYIGVQLD
ncbi:MAG: HAD family hydrolase [Spirochaetota bacterium]